jgi:hypothetical protein
MLSVSQLERNKKTFQDSNLKYGIFTQDLEDFLGEDFYISPASGSLDRYGCYPGGLLHHLIKACTYSIKICDIFPATVKPDTKTIVRTVFLSQIGKVNQFIPVDNVWVKKNTNKMYSFNNEGVRFKISERSVYYALTHGVTLSETEYQAILNLDKDDDDNMSKYFSEPLSQIIKMGFELAIIEEKNGAKKS